MQLKETPNGERLTIGCNRMELIYIGFRNFAFNYLNKQLPPLYSKQFELPDIVSFLTYNFKTNKYQSLSTANQKKDLFR
jgi:hypothetical protein